MGRILGNLDCETDFAACLGHPDRPATGRRTLSRAALDTAADLATLLRAFARDGDRLWTPATVAPQRVAEVPGLPQPALESGPLGSLAPPREVLAWGETPAAAAHRRRASEAETEPVDLADGLLHERLWRLPAADPAVAAKVHHRAFALDVARRLGADLPGSCMLGSPAELRKHLREVGPALGTAGRWVLKAPLSAAGRLRAIGTGHPKGDVARRVERLFERHGPLLFEPWLERTADFGIAGLVGSRDARLVAFHRSLIGRRGAFLGLELDASFRGLRGLAANERERLETVFAGVAHSLRQRGYSGPFGIDCWRYRGPAYRGPACRGPAYRGPAYRGATTDSWHPLGEINARMTFGLVARALVDRIRQPAGLDSRATVRLRISPPAPQGARERSLPASQEAREMAGEPPADAPVALVPLLFAAPGRRAAWLEVPV